MNTMNITNLMKKEFPKYKNTVHKEKFISPTTLVSVKFCEFYYAIAQPTWPI